MIGRYLVSECAERYLYTIDTHKTYAFTEAAQNETKAVCCMTQKLALIFNFEQFTKVLSLTKTLLSANHSLY